MKNLTKFLTTLAVSLSAGSLATPVYAVSCGDYIQPNTTVVLTQNLSCQGKDGMGALNVPFGDATINLNGRTITCTGANCGTGASSIGIMSSNVSVPNVKIIGPGKIIGFGTGIRFAAYAAPLGDGTGLSISQVTILGPGRKGIWVTNSGAASCGTAIINILNPPPPNFSISDNLITGQVEGIYVVDSYCGVIENNQLMDNNGYVQSADNVAIGLYGDYNKVSGNVLAHNGFGNTTSYLGTGIRVGGGSNQISANYLTIHHAHGISIVGSKGGNAIYSNTARFTNYTGYDMADYTYGSSPNSWNSNNVCHSQYGLPAGVCNAGE